MKIVVDLHAHTVASGHAYSTVKEMAEGALSRGLQAIAITDHGLNFPGGPHEYHFYNLNALPKYLMNVEILKGVEANIMDERGKIDMPEYLLKRLDVVIAGFHYNCGYESSTEENNTDALLRALMNPYVHFISHPGNPQYKVDLEKIAHEAKKMGKALEINNSSFSVSRQGSSVRCKELLKYAKKYETLLVVNSDAHIYTAAGEVKDALDAIESTGISEKQILNISMERVQDYLTKHKKRQISLTA
jgi:putative hydrolase